MNIRDLDLNLLLVFDAIYRERSISAAAKKLQVSQPAISNALRRLRDFTGDALFFRSANQMMPTRVASSLAVPISHALATVEETLTAVRSFDPATSTRTFHVGSNELFGLMFLPALVNTVEREAPGIRLQLIPQETDPAHTLASVRNGDLDTGVLIAAVVDDTVNHAIVSNEKLVFAVRKGHPLAGKPVTAEALCNARHIASHNTPGIRSYLDNTLTQQGVDRSGAMLAPNTTSIPAILEVSDLVAIIGENFVKRYMRDHALAILDTPIVLPTLRAALIWSKAAEDDQGHKWLRQHIEQILKTVFLLEP